MITAATPALALSPSRWCSEASGAGPHGSRRSIKNAAVAQGQVSASRSNGHKPVQHLEGGIVREILVHDSQQVKEGDVLFRLQPTAAQANLGLLRKQIDASVALEARLVAEQTQVPPRINFPADLLAHRKVAETDHAGDQRPGTAVS